MEKNITVRVCRNPDRSVEKLIIDQENHSVEITPKQAAVLKDVIEKSLP